MYKNKKNNEEIKNGSSARQKGDQFACMLLLM